MNDPQLSPVGGGDITEASQNRVLRNTFILLAISLIPTVIGASIGLAVKFSGFGPWWLNMLVLFGVVMGFSYAVERTKHSSLGVVILLAFTLFMGFWLSKLIGYILPMKDGAMLVMYAFGGTAGIFAAMAVIASMIKRPLDGMGKFLWIGFFVILAAAIGAVVFKIGILAIVCSILFIGLFSAWTVYDLNQIITGGETNYISATMSIYINMFNIFSNLLSLLGIFGGDD